MPRAESRPNQNASIELKAGQPWLGASDPSNDKFVGWILVQLWEPSQHSDGININWSGPQEELFQRATQALRKATTELP